MIFPLHNEEKERLKRLSQDKATLLALKKMLINAASERPASYHTDFIAAKTIAVNMLSDIFHDIETMQPEPPKRHDSKNLV